MESRPSQKICPFCRKLELLVRALRNSGKDRKRGFGLSTSVQGLETSAREGCATCRILWQATHLPQSTVDLKEPAAEFCFEIQFLKRPRFGEGRLSIGLSGDITMPHVPLVKLGASSTRDLKVSGYRSPSDEKVTNFALKLLRECISEHSCHNLRYNNKKPFYLLHILSSKCCQLVKPVESAVDYAYCALSYPWGEKWQESCTLSHNVDRRINHSFNILEGPDCLAKSIQDAVAIVKRLGIPYIWVDSLCIVQDDPARDMEFQMMHEYYGNAEVTLSLSSISAAEEAVSTERAVWSFQTPRCRIDDELADVEWPNMEECLDHVRSSSHLASRGWALQEELLSPRVLYWTQYGIFWSCKKKQRQEGRSDNQSQANSRAPGALMPQNFLGQCLEPDDKIHASWNDLLMAYSRRYLKKLWDRYPALSGLAKRYYDAQRIRAISEETYYAGLWRASLDLDLLWVVEKATTPSTEKPCTSPRCSHTTCSQAYAPTWSWASLPLGTSIETCKESSGQRSKHFRLREANIIPMHKGQEYGRLQSARLILEGRLKQIPVLGSRERAWNEPRDGRPCNLPTMVGIDNHAWSTDGSLLQVFHGTSGVHWLLGRLDYVSDVSTLSLHALEVRDQGALILASSEDTTSFERVGVAWNFSKHFFTAADSAVVHVQ